VELARRLFVGLEFEPKSGLRKLDLSGVKGFVLIPYVWPLLHMS
jgi:hypothetical protein